jgi:hypothetical protein
MLNDGLNALLVLFILGTVLWLWHLTIARVGGRWWRRLTTGGLVLVFAGLLARAALAPPRESTRETTGASMAERVPEPRETATLLDATKDRLATYELEIENSSGRAAWRRRRDLSKLHDQQVVDFIEAPGFGRWRTPPPIQKVSPSPSTHWTSTEAFPGPETNYSDQLELLHHSGVLSFLNLRGFGIVEDRTRVVGFERHGFRDQAYWTRSKLVADRVELVSLLLQPEPAVYQSDRLPTMEAVREFPTRPLDAFETASLGLLRAGEDMTSASSGEVTRAFGSIRSAKQCVTCHGGERGDLLGAFSYMLRAKTEQKLSK